MTVYILNLIFSCAVMAYFNKLHTRSKIHSLRFNVTNEWTPIVFIILVWSILYAIRFHVGADAWYLNRQFHLRSVDIPWVSYITQKRDHVYMLIEYLTLKISNKNWIFMNLVLGLLTYIPVLFLITHKSQNTVMAVFLYICNLSFYSGYNGTRQALAMGFLTLAVYFGLFRQQYRIYAILMFCAVCFHAAVILIIPFHFLAMMKVNSAKTFLIVAGLTITAFFLASIWSNVIGGLQAVGQEKLAEDYVDIDLTGREGTNILHLLVASSIVVFLFYLKMQNKNRNVILDGELMFMIFSTIFMLYSFYNVIFARLASLFAIEYIVLPNALQKISPQKRRLFIFFICLMFFLQMVIRLRNGEGHYYPYQYSLDTNPYW